MCDCIKTTPEPNIKERPILFSGPMVRALLSGQKTQTRRTVKVQTGDLFDINALKGAVQEYIPLVDSKVGTCGTTSRVINCPYGQVGDRLWVREAHTIHNTHGQHRNDGQRWGPWGGLPTRLNEDRTKIAYFREGFDRSFCGTWKPSIHMPRWASRLTLEITDIRVERLQDISDKGQPNDCIREGVFSDDYTGTAADWLDRGFHSIEKCRFHDLWTSINGPESWTANPWVWVVTFEVMK